MSVHPNTVLFVELVPDDLPNKTFRAIVEENAEGGMEDPSFEIEGDLYHFVLAESDYDRAYQLRTKKGCIYALSMVTYGYGQTISWEEIATKKNNLEAWSVRTARIHNCEHTIGITANYW